MHKALPRSTTTTSPGTSLCDDTPLQLASSVLHKLCIIVNHEVNALKGTIMHQHMPLELFVEWHTPTSYQVGGAFHRSQGSAALTEPQPI